jgi:hypothetical protein
MTHWHEFELPVGTAPATSLSFLNGPRDFPGVKKRVECRSAVSFCWGCVSDGVQSNSHTELGK